MPTAPALEPLLVEERTLASEYRARSKTFELVSVRSSDVDHYLAHGWQLHRAGKYRSRVRREKQHGTILEDRLWRLCYRMGYRVLNGPSFKIAFLRSDRSKGTKQIDVYAEDADTVLIIECKSRSTEGRRSLQKDIHETSSLQNPLRNSILSRYRDRTPPKIVWLYATHNIVWSHPDIQRADACQIHRITERELQYFEAFLAHIGPAGKYQLLAEFLKGKKIPGFAGLKIPAIRGRVGGDTYYSFVTTPRRLLPIAFINHHALDHPDGRPAYQRMVNRNRIREIGQFIKSGGYFPTNILVNFSSKPRFDLISNKDNTDPNIKFGWLTLPSQYRSAWIIDGQHRLYGFSHLGPDYLDQDLFVVAFAKMPPAREADLFITINHKQKSVPRSLLLSLLPAIKMGDSSPSTALSALASAVQQTLDRRPGGALYGRFAIHGMPPDTAQNLTVAEMVNGLRRSGLVGIVKNRILLSGPLSGGTDAATIDRASTVLDAYFDRLRQTHPQRWKDGRAAHICTNPGIRAHLLVVESVISHLTHKQGTDCRLMPTEDIADRVTLFCAPLFSFLRDASDDQVATLFSRHFGEGGVKTYAYHLMRVLHNAYEDFGSEEFRTWVEQTESERIQETTHFLLGISERLTNHVIDTLQQIYGTHRLDSGEQAFWEIGVGSDRVRRKAYDKQQEDRRRRKPKEAYLDIVDLIEIVKQKDNWHHFESVFNNPREGERRGKKYYLDWMNEYNELRKIAAHPNRVRTYTKDDLEFVDWLLSEVSPKIPK